MGTVLPTMGSISNAAIPTPATPPEPVAGAVGLGSHKAIPALDVPLAG
jgi:hypothetical protein